MSLIKIGDARNKGDSDDSEGISVYLLFSFIIACKIRHARNNYEDDDTSDDVGVKDFFSSKIGNALSKDNDNDNYDETLIIMCLCIYYLLMSPFLLSFPSSSSRIHVACNKVMINDSSDNKSFDDATDRDSIIVFNKTQFLKLK